MRDQKAPHWEPSPPGNHAVFVLDGELVACPHWVDLRSRFEIYRCALCDIYRSALDVHGWLLIAPGVETGVWRIIALDRIYSEFFADHVVE